MPFQKVWSSAKSRQLALNLPPRPHYRQLLAMCGIAWLATSAAPAMAAELPQCPQPQLLETNFTAPQTTAKVFVTH